MSFSFFRPFLKLKEKEKKKKSTSPKEKFSSEHVYFYAERRAAAAVVFLSDRDIESLVYAHLEVELCEFRPDVLTDPFYS